MDHFFEILSHTFLDTVKMLPFLFGVYLLIEFLEHKATGKLANVLRRLGPFGPVGGAALGCLPQCGFSVAASNLYSGRLISLGTLLAVFIATSDEAIPILLSSPNSMGDVWKLILAKVIIAIIAGLFVDGVIRFFKRRSNEEAEPYVDLCENCGCENHGIWLSALKHTLQIFIFLFAIALALEALMHIAGEELLSKILMQNSIFQPILAALIGLIPNCAPSVVLTDLYVNGNLSFGSVVAGLSTGAGMGLVVLFKVNKNLKQNVAIVGVLYVIGALSGMIIDLVF
ncbi:MAG: arsenic efflux protein [Oscillospiraceae bacterium]|nr:arsenic efflux protein [Oscillospiraceae bacterium]